MSEIVRQGEDEDVVGLHETVKHFCEWIVNDSPVWVQTITGMVGIGKTTLARQIYNHADVIDRFERRAWVCVSGDLTHKEVIMKLIQQVVESKELERDSLMEKMERADNQSLHQMLHQYLQGIRYFIVFDDLPKGRHFHSIMEALPCEEAQSRLLLTSRCDNTSSPFGNHFHYKMRPLDSDKSWKLFVKTIFCDNKFPSESKDPRLLETKGKKMLTKCGGIPLAIKHVGRQVAEKRLSGSEWEGLFESIDFDATLDLLVSNYQKLNPELKLCFLHLAFFKENTTIRSNKLKLILAAGGMLSRKDFRVEFALECLVSEYIIEVHYKSIRSVMKSFDMNATLHSLSVKKAKDEIGFEILRNNEDSRPASKEPRHRVIHCSREKFNYSTDKDKLHLVSLFFHGGGYFDASPSYWKSFELLWILDLEDFGLKILPESIGKLIELRYLGLRNNHIKEIPYSLGCLKKLEVLDIALNFLMEVPDIIWEMVSLRHLYMSDVICWKPLMIDALQNLETLTYISVDNWTYELWGLQMMTSLRKLGIEELDENADISKLSESLAALGHLETLILRGFRCRSMPCLDKLGILHGLTELKLDGLLVRLPSAENFPPNIRYLRLVNSCLAEDPMPILERLPMLDYLKLRNAYTGQQMVILKGGFPRLDVMCLEELWNLRNIQAAKDAMWYVIKLRINSCPYLETLPEEFNTMDMKVEMLTTKKIAAKIQKSGLISKRVRMEVMCTI